MKHLKSIMLAAALSASLASPAIANEAPARPLQPAFSAVDMGALFEQDAKPMQLALLSPQEMRETEGAFLPVAFAAATLISGFASGLFYHGLSYYTTGSFGSSSGAAWAIGSGLLGGIHGGGLAAGAKLTGWAAPALTLNGMGVSGTWNFANPWR